jgi:hypothetical protein
MLAVVVELPLVKGLVRCKKLPVTVHLSVFDVAVVDGPLGFVLGLHEIQAWYGVQLDGSVMLQEAQYDIIRHDAQFLLDDE